MKNNSLIAALFTALVVSIPAFAEDPKDLKDMTPAERRAHMESLSDEERQALREKRKARMEQRRAEWEAMTPEEREAKMAERKEKGKGRRGRGKKPRDGGE